MSTAREGTGARQGAQQPAGVPLSPQLLGTVLGQLDAYHRLLHRVLTAETSDAARYIEQSHDKLEIVRAVLSTDILEQLNPLDLHEMNDFRYPATHSAH